MWVGKKAGTQSFDNTEDYFLGGRDLGWFVIGASLFASNIGSEHLVGLAGQGASGDYVAAQFEILAALMLLILGWVFVPFYLKSGVYTMPEFLEKRYGTGARDYLSWVSIVVVLSQNRPRLLGDIAENASAVILAYQPGSMRGMAIADVIYGEVNPSGRLPFTYPRYEHGISTYDHAYADEVDPMYGTNGFNPQWEFGHGLSYSEFTYANLSLGRDSVFKDDTLIVLVELENNGSRTGKGVVQVYISDEVASLVPSVKRLRDFEKIELDENQSKSVTFHIDIHDLGFVHPGEASKSVESGWFTLSVGDLSARFFVKQ